MAVFYVIATPIGNLEDITLRAIRILKSVDIVLCEDTRVTKRLFERHGISTSTLSYHAQSDKTKTTAIFDLISKDKNIALVTDAGTPGISDPGSFLISEIRFHFRKEISKSELKIESIPGPSVLTSALSIAGVSSDEFTFLGFIPHKKGRETLLKEIISSERTMVFFESSHRIIKTLQWFDGHLSNFDKDKEHLSNSDENIESKNNNKKITIVREITKIYEEVMQGSPKEIFDILKTNPEKQRGEFVVIVSE